MSSQIDLQQLERILAISRDLSTTAALQDLLHKIVEAASELTASQEAGILLFDEHSGQLHFHAATNLTPELTRVSVPLEGSIAGSTFTSGQAIIVSDARSDPRYYPAVEESTGLVARSLLAVPLQFKEQRIGVIEVENKQNGQPFVQQDIDTLTVLAAQAAVAIANAQMRQDLEKARDLAQALRQASAALSSTLDHDQVLDRIMEQVSKVVAYDAVNIMLIEGDTVRVFRRRGYERFAPAAPPDAPPMRIADMPRLAQIVRTRQPLVIPDTSQDKDWVYSRPDHTWIQSYIGVPISAREQIIGFLNVNSATRGFFTADDGERLRTFADHAAIAIENARLYRRVQQELGERIRAQEELSKHHDHLEELVQTRTHELAAANEQLQKDIAERMAVEAQIARRNAELAAQNAIATTISQSLDLYTILRAALEQAGRLLEMEAGGIYLLEPDDRTLTLHVAQGLSDSFVDSIRQAHVGHGPVGLATTRNTPLVLHTATSGDGDLLPLIRQEGLQTMLVVPLASRSRLMGSLVLATRELRSVSPQETSLLTTIAQQIGVAAENARLFIDVLRERQITQILLDTTQALSSTLRFDELLERVLDELQRLVPYQAATINMLQGERCWTLAFRGLSQPPQQPIFLNQHPPVQQVVKTATPSIVTCAQAMNGVGSTCTIPFYAGPAAAPGTGKTADRHSWMGVPLLTKGKVIGVLMLDSPPAQDYDQEAARLTSVFAQQVALSLENSRLYEQVQTRLRETTLLQSVTAFISSTFDLQQILPYVARSLCEILNGTSVEIYGLKDGASDPRSSAIVLCTAAYATPASTAEEQAHCTGSERQLTELPLALGALLRRRPVQAELNDQQIDPPTRDELAARGAYVTLVLPMISGDHPLGFVQVWDSQFAHHFADSEIAAGQTLVHQAAITIDNSRLVEALRQHTVELEAQNAELDAFAHTVAHDLKNPLTALLGLSSLLESRFERIPPDKMQFNLRLMGQSAQKMQNIIDELMLLASVRKQEDVKRLPLNMAVIIDEALARLDYIVEENEAQVVLPPSWPLALGYAPWIEEVWTNYLSNAFKYGGPPPRVEVGATEQETGMVRFWVRDNGPGLSAEEQAALFTPFTRLHQARSTGHGLGLSIVQRIVEKMGGKVGVESSGVPGQGSTFYFELPRAPEPVTPEA